MKIEKNIPVPPKTWRNSIWQDLLAKMKPGDSILLDKKQASSFRASATYKGYEVVQRKEPDGQIRVWKK